MFHSIRWRIAVPYVLLIIFAMTGLGVYLSNVVRQSYLDQMSSQLTVSARLVADAVSPALKDTPAAPVFDGLAKRYASLLGMRVTIIAPDGTVLGESDENRALMDNHLTRPEVAAALAHGGGSSIRESTTLNIPMYYVAIRTPMNNPPATTSGPTTGIVRVALPLQQIDTAIGRLQRIILGATALVAALAIIVATLVAGRITVPLRELTEAIGQMSGRGFQGQEPISTLIPHTMDEVGKLTEVFNGMAVQLQEQIGALEAEHSKLTTVLQEMTDGVLIVGDDGQVQLLNKAAESMFGISQERAARHSVAETLRDHQIFELWQRVKESGQPQSTILETGEKRLSLQVAATRLGEALPGGTLLLFQNLTRLRQVETMRRDFISNVSHELRTPLASLKALTETLQDGALEDPPAARRFLQRIETEVDSMSLMVAELLELSRIESGRVPLQLVPTRPLDILTPAVERLKLQAERASLILSLECPEDLPLVMADRPRLEQVTVNLLHNAIKFTPEGGKITVGGQLQNERVVLSVADTGIGIPANELSRIFERFYKGDRARASGGTGLGLSIARHLVEAHGGRIWVESVSGQGSVFYFTIPRAD